MQDSRLLLNPKSSEYKLLDLDGDRIADVFRLTVSQNQQGQVSCSYSAVLKNSDGSVKREVDERALRDEFGMKDGCASWDELDVVLALEIEADTRIGGNFDGSKERVVITHWHAKPSLSRVYDFNYKGVAVSVVAAELSAPSLYADVDVSTASLNGKKLLLRAYAKAHLHGYRDYNLYVVSPDTKLVTVWSTPSKPLHQL